MLSLRPIRGAKLEHYRRVGVFEGRSVAVEPDGSVVCDGVVGKMDLVVGALGAREVLVRGVRLDPGVEKGIEEVRDFLVEPFVVAPSVICHQVVKRDELGMRLSVFVAQKEAVAGCLDCEVLGCVQGALAEVGALCGEGRVGVAWRDVAVVARDGKVLAASSGKRARVLFRDKGLKEVFELEGMEWQGVDLGEYGVALGLALGGGGIDFRQGEFAYRKRWKRERGRLLGFGTACVALCLGMVLLGGVMERGERERAGVYLEELSGARVWESFALWPDVPRAKDVLVWLDGQERVKRVESFRYGVTRMPRVGAERERFEVGVEVVFEAESATAAREFHDELREGGEFVGEVTSWGVRDGLYRVCFGLKDRTRYYG